MTQPKTATPRSARLIASAQRRLDDKLEFQNAPPLKKLRQALDRLSDPSVDEIFDLAIPSMRDVSWMSEYLAKWLEDFLENHYYLAPLTEGRQPFSGSEFMSFLPIFKHPMLIISAHNIGPEYGKRSESAQDVVVGFGGQPSASIVVSGGSVTYGLWRVGVPISRTTDLNADLACEADGELTLAPGQGELRVDRKRTSAVVSRVSGAACLLHFSTPVGALPFSVGFHTLEKRVVRIVPSSRRASRAMVIIEALRNLGGVEYHEALEACLQHEAFFVRWPAMRELVRLKGVDALADLEKFIAAEDSPSALRAGINVRSYLQARMLEHEHG